MSSLPLPDAGSLASTARLSWALWGALAATLLAALLVFVAQSRGDATGGQLLAPGEDAVVVLDLSSSTRSAAKPIARVLRTLTGDPQRRLGLVVFSNSAYEALPPSTPVDGLAGWLDRFARTPPADYPWSSFTGGTTISSGLVLARRMLRRDHVVAPHVVLVSDLVDPPSDLERLQTTVAQYQREGIDLRIVTVRPPRQPRSAGVPAQLPNATFVERAASATIDPTRSGGGSGRLPVLLALVGALAVLAALYELLFHPLTWKAGT